MRSRRTGPRLAPLAAFAVVAVAGQVACAAPAQVCPTRIHVESGTVAAADVPAGFKGSFSTTSSLLLSGVNVFNGPPERGGQLMPDSDKGAVSTWKFDGAYPDGKWLSCDYAGGLIHVATRADDNARSCQATFRETGSPKLPHAEFTCK